MLIRVEDHQVLEFEEIGAELAKKFGWKFIAANHDIEVGLWDIKFTDSDGAEVFMTIDGCLYTDEECEKEHEWGSVDIRDEMGCDDIVWGEVDYNDGTPNRVVALIN